MSSQQTDLSSILLATMDVWYDRYAAETLSSGLGIDLWWIGL